MSKRPLNPGDFREEEERFARRLWAARKLGKLSHAKLAERTGVAKPFISLIENLRATPSLVTCARLARGVGRDLGDLTTERPVEDLDSVEGWSPT
ncbi:helix-turn-helix transcriptional regulator [Sphingomonas oryzagri]